MQINKRLGTAIGRFKAFVCGLTPKMVAFIVLGVVFMALLMAWLFCLPRDLFEDAEYSTVVEDSSGELIGARISSDGQWCFPPSSEPVPDTYATCLIEFEDRWFRYHPGVNPVAIFRALRQNIVAGRTVSGASTISMQVIRMSRSGMSSSASGGQNQNSRFTEPIASNVNNGATTGNREVGNSKGSKRNIWEKLIEAVLATRLEARYTKDEILGLYAANAPFGGNVIGIEAASWRYFSHSPSELSWAEAATLAVLPNSPSLIHPGKNRTLLLNKRNRLLKRLSDDGKISREDYEVAIDEELPLKPAPLPQYASHLVEYFRKTKPGCRVTTSVDLGRQIMAEAVADRWNADFALKGMHDLSVVVVDVRSGLPVIYIGNASAEESRPGAKVDIARSPRSTGSILKPFLYAASLQEGVILPNTLLPDIPININGFTPQNFDRTFAGAVPASIALTRSLNVPAVNMLRDYGVSRFLTLLRDCGLTGLNRSADDYGLSLILGGAEARLYDVTMAYAAMAHYYLYGNGDVVGGSANRVAELTQGDDSKRTTYSAYGKYKECGCANEWLSKAWPLTDKCALWYTFNALTELNRPDEMDWKMVASAKKVAWKTGTSFGFRDGWAVGVTPEYAMGVWVGNAAGEGAPGLVGAVTAGPVMFDIFNLLRTGAWFPEPSSDDCVVAETCSESGHLCNMSCEHRDTVFLPKASLTTEPCPYHHYIRVTADGRYRVPPSESMSPGSMLCSYFTLPPAMEWYYCKSHPEYRKLPPYLRNPKEARNRWNGASGPVQSVSSANAGVSAEGSAGGSNVAVSGVQNSYIYGDFWDDSQTLAFIYPEQGANIVVPRQPDGSPSEVVFSVAHSYDNAEIFWHLDSEYVGSTKFIHKMPLRLSDGTHCVTVEDAFGSSSSVRVGIKNL